MSIDNLRRAVEQSPENAPLRSHLGDLLAAAGRQDEALTGYQAALAREPSADLQLAVADCFLALGRMGEAAALIEHVLDRDATSVRARYPEQKRTFRPGRPAMRRFASS